MKPILIVEDEPKIAALLEDYLKQSGYTTHVLVRGDEAVDWIRNQSPSLVLLDIMLPGKDGLDVCREVRSFSQVPIVMLTARVEEIDRLLGLELGADDYVCKPFSPREVVARVKAILRRTGKVEPDVSGYRGIEIDHERFSCRVNGQNIELTPVEFKILVALHEKPGRVLSREQLMDRAYDDHRVVSQRTIDSHMKNLRRKLDDAMPDGDSDPVLRSVYGVGYKLD